MQVQELKEYILDNDYVEQILEELGCKSVRNRGDYVTAANKDGNNNQAIVVYKNENLTTINYTRQIAKDKKATDLFDLISFCENYSFPEALKWTHDILGLDYYDTINNYLPESLQILKLLKEMSTGAAEEDNEPLKPIPDEILSYYLPYGNKMWEDDGVSLTTQRFFELGFDPYTNSVTIPIRDEIGTLVAVKARRLEYNPEFGESKYFFCEPGPKSQVLYGLYQNSKAIQAQGVVYVGESEKFIHQIYEIGYYGVSVGGSKVSKRQIEMLTRLGVKIVFCFDKDISEDDLKNIISGFMDGIPVYAIIDKDNILDEKESPSDCPEKWYKLIKNHIYKISKGGDSDG